MRYAAWIILRRAMLGALVLLSVGLSISSGFAAESAETKSHMRTSQFVTMRDGTRLAVDVLLPGVVRGVDGASVRFPVIFQYTPYGRSSLDMQTRKIRVRPDFQFFLSHGYAIVCADMRGTGASFGWMNQFERRLRDDGKDLVDWIAAQPWSDGNVGMTGGSYVGWSQLAVASGKPKALKAIAPLVVGWDGFVMHPGGIYSQAFMQAWSALIFQLNRGSAFSSYAPALPVIDEDGDGDVVDEIPIDLDGDGGFIDDYRWPLASGPAPRYADGMHRQHHYYLDAVMQHAADPAGAPGTFDADTVFNPLEFWDTQRPGDGLTSPDLNWAWLPEVADSGVAILNLGGWFDPFIRSSFELHSTLAGKNPARIVVYPSYHQGISPAFAEAIGAGSSKDLLSDQLTEQLRWFDHWLKHIDNGVDRAPPVRVFVVNSGWRDEAMWPPARVKNTKLYLDASHGLITAASPKSHGRDQYRVDFTHYSGWAPPLETAPIAAVNRQVPRPAPAVATYLRNRQFMLGVPASAPVRTKHDRKALVYTSAPLEQDTDIIGHPLVHIWASSTAPDGDFFFYLEDVDPNGEALLVSEYQHRAGFARLRSNDEMIPNNPGIDVKPDLPWHGFRRADYDNRVFAGGKVVPIITALYPTAWRFRKGHSIRLAITGADWPTFALHPKLSPQNRPGGRGNIVPTIAVHRGGPRASYLQLPIVPQG